MTGRLVAALVLAGCGRADGTLPLPDDSDAPTEPGVDDSADVPTDDSAPPNDDQDGDGHSPPQDCDDSDATVHPGADEVCGDDVDNDCDGTEDGAITVDGTHHFTSLSAAVAHGGAQVRICPGTWSSPLEITEDMVLVGHMGSAATTIDVAGAKAPAVQISSGAVVTLGGLTLSGGRGALDGHSGATFGGGIEALNAGALVLDDIVLVANQADYGAGLMGPVAGTLEIAGSVVRNNTAEESGGGLYVYDGAITGTLITNNQAENGGGLFVDTAGAGRTVTLDATSRLLGNSALLAGGGVYANVYDKATIELSTATLTGNAAAFGGGAFALVDGGDLTLEGGMVTDNDATIGGKAGGAGAGIYVYGDPVVLRDIEVTANTAERFGGGLAFEAGATTVIGLQLSDNESDLGGGMGLYDAAITVSGTEVLRNVATTQGGGAYLDATSALQCTGCDWGKGKDDNAPEDVWLDHPTKGTGVSGLGASFLCSAADLQCD